jgi:hypothetical protein
MTSRFRNSVRFGLPLGYNFIVKDLSLLSIRPDIFAFNKLKIGRFEPAVPWYPNLVCL